MVASWFDRGQKLALLIRRCIIRGSFVREAVEVSHLETAELACQSWAVIGGYRIQESHRLSVSIFRHVTLARQLARRSSKLEARKLSPFPAPGPCT